MLLLQQQQQQQQFVKQLRFQYKQQRLQQELWDGYSDASTYPGDPYGAEPLCVGLPWRGVEARNSSCMLYKLMHIIQAPAYYTSSCMLHKLGHVIQAGACCISSRILYKLPHLI